ncbi:MAG TPA: hemolysin family protein [Bacilli bacterium]
MESDTVLIIVNLVVIGVLVFLNGFFVAAEFALVKVRGSRIDALAEEGKGSAKFARNILNNLNAYLSACQLGITLASLGLGWLGEPTIARIIEPALSSMGFGDIFIHTISFIIAFLIITTLHITIGEQVPKTYAIRKSEDVTLWTSFPMFLFYKVMYPLIWFLNGTSNWLVRRTGIEPETDHESAHTEEEIRILMKESHKSGLIDNAELTLFDNIFEFSETNAREIMISRTKMVCLYENLSYDENKDIAIKEMHTRYPVCLPDKDNIIGFVHIKDLLKPNVGFTSIKQITRDITKVPESMPISALLKLMQKKKTQMALLIDEYGGTSGLVTFEDIIEEIVGEVQDEFDEERPSIEKKDDFTHSIDGRLLIEEVNSYFGLDIESDDFDTIGGWLYAQVEIPPQKNQKVNYMDEFDFIIAETDNMRISRIILRKLTAQQAQSAKRMTS